MGRVPPIPPVLPKDPALRKRALEGYRRELEDCLRYNQQGASTGMLVLGFGLVSLAIGIATIWMTVVSALGVVE